MNYIDWFSNIKLDQHVWNKSHFHDVQFFLYATESDFNFFMGLGIKTRALCILDKSSIIELPLALLTNILKGFYTSILEDFWPIHFL
jgi:hypothetical protein